MTDGSPLRIIHTSDWHLGHELHGFDRAAEHDAFLDWLIARIPELRPDALLVTGDIYDTVNPPVAAQRRLFGFLARAAAACPHVQIVLIGGNHDSAARVELPATLTDRARIHLVGGLPRRDSAPDYGGTCLCLRDRTGQARAVCVAVPYLRPCDLGDSGVAGVYEAACGHVPSAHLHLPLIVTGHLHVTGGSVSALSERRILLGGEEAFGHHIFPAHAAYVALGHLHKPQCLSDNPLIRYAGSPFPLSVTERGYRHSLVVLDVTEGGVCRHELVDIPRPVAFLRVPEHGALSPDGIEAALASLPKAAPDKTGDTCTWPYLEVCVALDGPLPDLRRRVEAALAGKRVRLARIERVLGRRGSDLAASVESDISLSELNPEVVFARCHQDRFGAPPDGALAQAFATLLAETLAGETVP